MKNESFIYATRLIHICKMINLYMQHGSFIYAKTILHICNATHSYTRHAIQIHSYINNGRAPRGQALPATYSNTFIYEGFVVHICVTVKESSANGVETFGDPILSPQIKKKNSTTPARRYISSGAIQIHSYMKNDSFIYATRLIHIRDRTHPPTHPPTNTHTHLIS